MYTQKIAIIFDPGQEPFVQSRAIMALDRSRLGLENKFFTNKTTQSATNTTFNLLH